MRLPIHVVESLKHGSSSDKELYRNLNLGERDGAMIEVGIDPSLAYMIMLDYEVEGESFPMGFEWVMELVD